MTPEELTAWKIQKKTEAYEEYEQDPLYQPILRAYEAKLQAIDAITA